jgi:hypothetical protein
MYQPPPPYDPDLTSLVVLVLAGAFVYLMLL